jgi:hypothetical protein
LPRISIISGTRAIYRLFTRPLDGKKYTIKIRLHPGFHRIYWTTLWVQGLDYILKDHWEWLILSPPPAYSRWRPLHILTISDLEEVLRIVQSFTFLPLGTAINRVPH